MTNLPLLIVFHKRNKVLGVVFVKDSVVDLIFDPNTQHLPGGEWKGNKFKVIREARGPGVL